MNIFIILIIIQEKKEEKKKDNKGIREIKNFFKNYIFKFGEYNKKDE